MNDCMTYKGFYGSIHYDSEEKHFYVQIEGIRSLVSYEGNDLKSLIRAFRESVDDYLQTCESVNSNR